MASLDQSATGIYHLHFRFPVGRAGQRHHRSLVTTDETEAKRIKAAVETTIGHLTEGVISIPERATSDQLWQFLRSGGRVLEQPTVRRSVGVDAIFDRFVTHRESTKPVSAKTEKKHCRQFKRVFHKLCDGMPKIEEIDLPLIRDYVKERKTANGIRGGKLRGDTIRKELATLKMMMDFAISEKYIGGANPFDGMKRGELPKKNRKPPFRTWHEIEATIGLGGLSDGQVVELWDCLFLRPEEIGAFLAHVKEASKTRRYPWIYPALAFCAYTGARRAEMFRCRVGDINGNIIIRERKADTDTEETTRVVPLHPKLAAIIDQWKMDHPSGQFLFCKANGNELEDRTSRDGWKAVTKGSKWENLRGYHVLRHSFISILAMNGRTQQEIMALAGHSTEEMFHRYCHLFPEKKEEAIAALTF